MRDTIGSYNNCTAERYFFKKCEKCCYQLAGCMRALTEHWQVRYINYLDGRRVDGLQTVS